MLAGHKSLVTTRLYLHLDKTELAQRVYAAMQDHDERLKRFLLERQHPDEPTQR